MLVWLLNHCATDYAAALEKITFRASAAAVVSFLLAVVLGGRMIGWLATRFREPIKCDSPEIRRLHLAKQTTPTMGGLFIVAGLVVGTLVLGDLGNAYLQTALLVTVGLATVGVVDDLAKLRVGGKGISARSKLLGQTAVASVAALMVYHQHAAVGETFQLWIPWAESPLTLGWAFLPLAVVVIVGSSNAVNLTDGLDGLAGGCLICAVGAMTVVAYASGHAELAEYLNLPRIPGAGEMTVLAGGMIGAMLGFLWFNCHPAQVFMGDTGSLPLGGLLGLIAVITRQELLLIVVGGVFVVEAASVIIQVGYFKWSGRRIFRCAPLHHHFQLLGWPESRITVRFWIASAVFAILGIACLKLNVRENRPPTTTTISTASVDSQHGARHPIAALGIDAK